MKFFLLIIVLCISVMVNAQKSFPPLYNGTSAPVIKPAATICYNDMMLYHLRKDAAFRKKENKMNLAIQNALSRIKSDTVTLPVVVHIINANPYAVTDAQVISGISLLNDAYSKSGIYAASAGADTKIRFCLSKKDPDGGISTGITRTTSFFSNHLNKEIEDADLKNLIQWDPSRYINIWLITSIDGEAYSSFSCGTWYRLGVGGYATLPPSSGALDGIVITAFGSILAHEMGHYLGLYHTFEGGCTNNDCLTDGDRVCDTPPDNTVMPSAGCSSPTNSCNTDTLSAHSNGSFFSDVPDQIANFMDYGNSACSIEFTQGQADRMHAAITTQRSGLLVDECSPPCGENITANFTRDVSYSIIGNTINFTNTSAGATNFQWLVNDIPVATTSNFTYVFNSAGKDKITLKAFNTTVCFASYSDFIITTCGVTAAFYTDKQTIASKAGVLSDSIIFTSISYGATSYQWLISNDQGMAEHVAGTNPILTYTFPSPANYFVRLIATNGACSDTTDTYTVPVLDPTADGVPFNVTLKCYQPNKVQVSFCLADYGYAEIPKNTPVNFYDADPLTAGAHKLSPTYYLPYAVPGGNCYICFTHVLNVDYHSYPKIYLVFNDTGTAIPVALPNTNFTESNYVNNTVATQPVQTTIFATICQGSNYGGHSLAGTYTDTLASFANGCDSIRTLHLTINPVAATTINASICSGQNYAGHTTTGTFVDVYTAVNGCDSTRTLHLTVKPVFNTTITTAICQGQNYAGHTTTGTYADVYTAANGCDSTRTLYLTVKPIVTTSFAATICSGQNYAGHTASGTYADTYPGSNGCDSIRTVRLTVNPVYNTNITTAICQGQNYAGHASTGLYVDVYTAVNGCDSTRTLQLTVNPVKFTTVTTAICQGENYAGHSITGTYIDVYATTLGCDSTRTLNLTVKPTVSTSIAAVICQDETYAGHTTTGLYVDVYTAANGCDSTRTLTLTVNPKSFTTVNKVICKGQSYAAGGQLQTTSGVYIDSALNYLGCDSIITTHLTVNLPLPNLGADRGICLGDVLILNPGTFTTYLWQDGTTANTYTTNLVGQYHVSVSDSYGCKNADTMNVLEIDTIPANFLPPDTSLCRGNIVHINVPNYVRYAWSTGSTASAIDVIKTGTYHLLATDKNGCTGNDSTKVFYYNCAAVWIPNAFTPNTDGLNENFHPIFPAPVTNYRMQIWNRWGLRVFETTNPKQGWDGRYKTELQSPGVFIYLINFRNIDGGDEKPSGTVMVVR